ncbi:MAG TPA: ABC transporter permease [Ramlibacter sp.]|uniref:ABC transporter permease n=1 Tax=Ramlibacter sp. TaxID=1917967 RepID=UPI002CAA0D8A|nr:ABC transporter permease [Ramlibacter sp.]HVZ44881.1 ABC transporter permease [Ramlibacter sp.]
MGRLRKLAVPTLLVATWLALSLNHAVDPLYLPSPSDLWEAIEALWPRLPSAFVSSVSVTLAGFVAGSVTGILCGLAMAASKTVRYLFGGLQEAIRPVPTFALIPLFVLWFGLGKAPQIAMVMFGSAILLSLATIEAVRNVPPIYVRASLLLGAGRLTVYRTVILPAIVPHIFGALRAAAVASWGRDVAAEYVGAQDGLGYLMIVQSQYFDTASMWVIIFIYSLLAISFDALLRAAQRPLTQWTDRNAESGVVANVLGQTRS